jgi:hypothetical protein
VRKEERIKRRRDEEEEEEKGKSERLWDNEDKETLVCHGKGFVHSNTHEY